MHFSITGAERKGLYGTLFVFCILLVLPQRSLAMKNVFRETYKAQKKLIGDAKVGMQTAIDRATKSAGTTGEAQQAAVKAVDQLAVVEITNTPTSKEKELQAALYAAKGALVAAGESLGQAMRELENTRKQLVDSQAELETMHKKNEEVGDQAGIFSTVRNGFFASIVANFAVIATLVHSWRKRWLELKSSEVDLEIKKAKLENIKQKEV
jgi:ABC-type transporter Mla subunit MlaD